MDDTATPTLDVIHLTADIVAAFISNNSLPASELPTMLISVHAAISVLANGSSATASAEPEPEKATPSQIKKSITPDALISFVDNKPYKTLKRHLSTRGLDFAAYRARYGLPSDYPTVAPNYSAARSALAKSLGLGQGGARAASKATASDATDADKPKRGRPAKTAV
ncbi:MucR family transcriptional regulator [Methylobacterium sp. WL9]|uniref:MucR family transcriptional regulator n=1 Tax=Methylobacterium sp. WL9 TaxID=2603898 RepID=UPI0011C91282|nr:MucR family transcriptional regulator [Methylobacterium sp. WL9]TXN21026.1 MucR family transcriptional regulator [Methylobacterium sp. WL9]